MKFNPKAKLDTKGFISPAQNVERLNARDARCEAVKRRLSQNPTGATGTAKKAV